MAQLDNGPLYLDFCKYQGTGNDFILVDNRKEIWQKLHLDQSVSRLCHRRYGIGADGIVLVQNQPGFDFQMVYFNADGSEGEMCGNGGRCAVAFSKDLGIINNKATFLAKDGAHEGGMNPDNNMVQIKMNDVDAVDVEPDGSCVLDTGVPHCVRFVCDLNKVDVVSEGRRIRYSDKFREKGINVDFVSTAEQAQGHLTQGSVTQNKVTQNDASHGRIRVLTYERGVEDETFSCGTGATASAIAFFFCKKKQKGTLSLDERGVSIGVSTRGGELSLTFDVVNRVFTNIFLSGPAKFVFEGRIKVY